MIEIPMVNTPNILNELLAEFRPLFDRRQFRQFSRYISFMGITNLFSCTPEQYIHGTYQSVQPEQISQEYPGTGDIQEVCRSVQPLFIGGFPKTIRYSTMSFLNIVKSAEYA